MYTLSSWKGGRGSGVIMVLLRPARCRLNWNFPCCVLWVSKFCLMILMGMTLIVRSSRSNEAAFLGSKAKTIYKGGPEEVGNETRLFVRPVNRIFTFKLSVFHRDFYFEFGIYLIKTWLIDNNWISLKDIFQWLLFAQANKTYYAVRTLEYYYLCFIFVCSTTAIASPKIWHVDMTLLQVLTTVNVNLDTPENSVRFNVRIHYTFFCRTHSALTRTHNLLLTVGIIKTNENFEKTAEHQLR